MTLRMPGLSAIAAAALALAAIPTAAMARVEAGSLNCRGPGGVGFVIGSVQRLHCVYFSGWHRHPQRYVAVIRRVGVDLGVTHNVHMAWAVFAPTHFVGPGDLAGGYGGVHAAATVGVGLGANALVGGSGNSFALQPLSGQSQVGLNVAAGFTGLELYPAGHFRWGHFRHHRRPHA